jgi:hypothetical protein
VTDASSISTSLHIHMASSNPPGWEAATSSQTPTLDTMQESPDQQMIRYLSQKYTRDQLVHMFDDMSQKSSSSDATPSSSGAYAPSIMSADTAMSDEPASIFDSGSSIRSFSDTSSIAGSVLSNVSQKTQRLFGRKSSTSQRTTWSNESSSSPTEASGAASTSSSKQKGSFTCGFCLEEGIATTCTRKNDLKRHIEDFHHRDTQWFCRQRSCGKVFDWEGAYKSHFKAAHGGTRTTMMLDDARVALCPQLVFACGFHGCAAVYEAAGSHDVGAVFKDYVSHIVKHFDEPTTATEWTHNWRMQNLLRQSSVGKFWVKAAETVQEPFTWSPYPSAALRKRLETRHIGDPLILVQYACLLGTNKLAPDQPLPLHLQEVSKTPARDGCPCQVQAHSAVDMDSSDLMQFRISRAHSDASNRNLRDYMASQRSVRVPPRPGSSVRGRAAPSSHQYMRPPMGAPATTAPGALSAHYLSPLPPGVQLGSTPSAAGDSSGYESQGGYASGMTLMPPAVGGLLHGSMTLPPSSAGGDVTIGMAPYPTSYATTGFSMTPDAVVSGQDWISEERQYGMEE